MSKTVAEQAREFRAKRKAEFVRYREALVAIKALKYIEDAKAVAEKALNPTSAGEVE